MNMKVFKHILDVACVVLGFSAFMDLLLWFTVHYLIPSWTIAICGLGFIALIQVLKRRLE